jgi:hypothetical protein
VFNQPTTIVGSGLFVCEALRFQPVKITAPYVKSAQLEPIDQETGSQADLFVDRLTTPVGRVEFYALPVQEADDYVSVPPTMISFP